jgi:two-component system, sensor histidine kinase PdtaS
MLKFMKKCSIIILFIFIHAMGRSQGIPADIPQLMIRMEQSKPDTQLINICIQLAGCYIVPGRSVYRIDSAARYLKMARKLNDVFKIPALQNRIDLFSAILHCILFSSDDPGTVFLPVVDSCKKTGDKLTEAQTWMYLGITIVDDPPSNTYKLTCFQNGLQLARQIGDSYTELRLEGLIAYVHVLQNKFDLAERELMPVLLEAQKISPAVTMYTCDELTFLYLSKSELNKALKYALETQRMMGICGDSSSADKYYQRLTSIYGALGNKPERTIWGVRNLEFKQAIDIPGVYKNIVDLVDLKQQRGKPGEALRFILKKIAEQKPIGPNDQRKMQQALGDAYFHDKIYDQAEKCYMEMIRLGNIQKYNYPLADRAFDNYKMGRYYFDRGLYKKSLPFIETSQKNYEEYGVLPYLRFNHHLLFTIDSALGDYTGAIRHLKEYDRIGDSVFNTARNGQIEELEIAYQTEQKDKSIRLLAEKEKLDQAELKHTLSTRNWIIAGASMLLIIAGLLYGQGQLRKKNNRAINVKNLQLQHLVTEKDWLVKEIHHRVKNNFQTVMGLLGTQAGYQKNDAAINAITDSQRRIQSMSLIHQKLYQSNNLSAINMPEYVHELIDSLNESFNTSNYIRFKQEIEPMQLDLAHSIPLGLILNEAITNSFKYAFKNNKEGIINILFKNISENNFVLVVSDNGIGLPGSFNSIKSGSMGMNLMRGLCEEIGAEFKIDSKNGTKITVIFKYDPDVIPAISTII